MAPPTQDGLTVEHPATRTRVRPLRARGPAPQPRARADRSERIRSPAALTWPEKSWATRAGAAFAAAPVTLTCPPSRAVAQSGSAPGLGPGGRRFKSSRPDHLHPALAGTGDLPNPRAARSGPAEPPSRPQARGSGERNAVRDRRCPTPSARLPQWRRLHPRPPDGTAQPRQCSRARPCDLTLVQVEVRDSHIDENQ